jgi:hypothetical protein
MITSDIPFKGVKQDQAQSFTRQIYIRIGIWHRKGRSGALRRKCIGISISHALFLLVDTGSK